MEPFTTVDAVALPFNRPNVDTDQIIPARFLWRKRKDAWAHLLLHDLRFDDDGQPKKAFILNQSEFLGAKIIVAGRNFGCGSSREHAVWCLLDYGIRAVIAPSFGDIFFANSFQNGLLPIVMPSTDVQQIVDGLEQRPGAHLKIDLELQNVTDAEGGSRAFQIDPFRKECLLTGADDISFTMRLDSSIKSFESEIAKRTPWI
jgi:3-isopropylmalate/(R)-2-methylmalate dehydratase small subunit